MTRRGISEDTTRAQIPVISNTPKMPIVVDDERLSLALVLVRVYEDRDVLGTIFSDFIFSIFTSNSSDVRVDPQLQCNVSED